MQSVQQPLTQVDPSLWPPLVRTCAKCGASGDTLLRFGSFGDTANGRAATLYVCERCLSGARKVCVEGRYVDQVI